MSLKPSPNNTLSAIETKVRRLTRSPSTAQLSEADLDNYINTFVVYDFPEHLRMFNLRTTFTFFTNPYQDSYPTDEVSFGANPAAQDNPLYNFQNNYLSIHTPVYIAGYNSFYTQSREQFFGIYPKTNSIVKLPLQGDGITLTFTGVINAAQAIILPQLNQQQVGLIQGEVLFSSFDTNLNGLALADIPVIDPLTGNKTVNGNLYDPNSAAYQTALEVPPTVVIPNNTINYATGVFTITFSAAPGAGAPVSSQSVPQALGLPQSLLYYDNKFTVRPVPDKPYRVQFEAYARPTMLLADNQSPALEEWFQYIAYGAAKKVFEDRLDMESVQMIMPEFKKQEMLCQRRTIVQYTNERTATIYTEQVSPNNNYGWWSGGGPF